MGDQSKGLLITAIGVLFVVPDSLFVRLIIAEPLITTFWRSIVAGLLILLIVISNDGINAFRQVFKAGKLGVLFMIFIGSTAPGFVLAVNNTSVANVVFIFAAIPLFTSFFSYFFLSEMIQRRILITSIFVVLGLGIIAYGSGQSGNSSWKGDLWALYVAIVYAGGLTILRRLKNFSMVPGVSIAYLASGFLIWFFCSPMDDFSSNWYLFLGHGLFIGIATCLLTIGPRFISSTEVALLVLLESVLAPVLVWLVVGEYPGEWTLYGGAIVLLSLLVSNAISLYQERYH